MKLYIFGPSGSGVSTFGRNLANKLDLVFLDSDDVFWKSTVVPFTVQRSHSEQVSKLIDNLSDVESWVLAGSIPSWKEALGDSITTLVYLQIDIVKRLQRLKEREFNRFGDRILPGGDMHAIHTEFIEWSKQYDETSSEEWGRQTHERWYDEFKGDKIIIDSDLSLIDMCSIFFQHVNH